MTNKKEIIQNILSRLKDKMNRPNTTTTNITPQPIQNNVSGGGSKKHDIISQILERLNKIMREKENGEYNLTINGTKPIQLTYTQEQPINQYTNTLNKQHKYALLIGIEYVKYASRKITERLPGCHYDVSNVKQLLINKLGYQSGNIITLMDSPGYIEPNFKNIELAIQKILGWSAQNPDSHLFIHYSGHGVQIRDTDGDELDLRDECIMPSDYLNNYITDDWLFVNFIKKLPIQASASMLFDCCNSGTLFELKYRYDNKLKKISKSHTHYKRTDNNVVSLSGCRDYEYSVSTYNLDRRQKWQGALTWAFVHSMSHAKLTNKELMDKVVYKIKSNNFNQNPVMCFSKNANILNEPFFK